LYITNSTAIESLKSKKFWKNIIPDYKIRKTPRVILEKNRAREERHRVGKVILSTKYILLLYIFI
jgi:hypothetical protein